MRFVRYFSALGALLALSVASALAGVTSRGVDISRPSESIAPDHLANQCFVLWFGEGSFNEIARLKTVGFNITETTDPAAVSAASLAAYDVLVIAYTGPGVLGSKQSLIESFVSSGHGLLIHQPDSAGVVDYAPGGLGLVVTDRLWCDFPARAFSTIVDGSHPITLGLADSDLSGAFDQVATLGPGYRVLARSVACGDPALAVGTLGSGRVVFEDGNASPIAIVRGSDAYWGNLFSWLCSAGVTAAGESTWGNLKVVYR